MRRKFHTLDVFTETPLAGNPLAVVLDCAGLDATRMQAIAREFNLSETVFVLDARDPVNTARIRIFTPLSEMPFAGHPTLGAAALIARTRAPDLVARGDLRIVLEEGVGDVVCEVRRGKGAAMRASFVVPRLPERFGDLADLDAIAAALSLRPTDIGLAAHRPSVWSAGTAFAFIPIASREAIARARAEAPLFATAFGEDAIGAFLYTSEAATEGGHIHARMFAPRVGVLEDPATGSAAAAFAGVAVEFERPEDGDHTIVIEQGFEMGRPSLIVLTIDVSDGALASASVGGSVVGVAEGFIDV